MFRCSACCETKAADEFAQCSRNKSGRKYVCRSCQSIYYAAWRSAQKQTLLSDAPEVVTSDGSTMDTAASEAPSETPLETPSEGAMEVDHLYLLRYPWGESPIKVGRAKDVDARVRQLERGHNFKLQQLAIFPGQGWIEHRVHTLLSKHKATDGRGQEWFHVSLGEALLAVAACVHSAPLADLGANKTPQACHSAM